MVYIYVYSTCLRKCCTIEDFDSSGTHLFWISLQLYSVLPWVTVVTVVTSQFACKDFVWHSRSSSELSFNLGSET